MQVEDVVADRQCVGPGQTEGQLIARRKGFVAPEYESRVRDDRQPARIEPEKKARLDGDAGRTAQGEIVSGGERDGQCRAESPPKGGVAAAGDADLR